MTTHSRPARPDRRFTALYRNNLEQVGPADIVLAGYGGAGQSIIANALLELRLNYVDPYTELLHEDGSTSHVTDHAGFRSRMAALHARDTGTGRRVPERPWPRFFKTHLPPEVFPRRVGGLWLVVRDPRDALHSWYQWRKNFAEVDWDRVRGDFGQFLREADHSGRRPAADWAYFYSEWLRYGEGLDRMVCTRFEDVKSDPLPVLRDALRSLGLVIPDDAVAAAIRRSSFDAMRAHEDKVAAGGPGGPARMMRRGKVGEWQEWMTPKLAGYLSDDAFVAVARQFGYSIG
nr:sulfotransferase domain-containing protein [uncultured Actinoplanes sp.]